MCASFCLNAQTNESLPVEAWLGGSDGMLEGLSLVIEADSGEKQVSIGEESKITDNKGVQKKVKKFYLALPFNQEFTLVFSKPGFITKQIRFDTHAPIDRIEQGFYPVKLWVTLFERDSINDFIFTEPGTTYKYVPFRDDFYIENHPSKPVAFLSYNNGVKKFQEGDYPGAINEFTEALSFNPKDIDALYNRAVARLKLKDTEGACIDLKAVKLLGKNDADQLLKKYCEQSPGK